MQKLLKCPFCGQNYQNVNEPQILRNNHEFSIQART